MAALRVVEELVLFLKTSTKPELRITALSHVSGLTCEESGVSYILNHKDLLVSILTLLKDKVNESALLAYKTLINITASEYGASCIINDFDVMGELLSTICDPNSAVADEAAKLLNNLTRSERGSLEFLKKCRGPDEICVEYSRLKEFIDSFSKDGYNVHALPLDYIASILANITQTSEGRKHIMDHDGALVIQILPFLRHKSLIRRKGIAMTIKNCCFDHEYHEQLLCEDLELLPQLLLPLAGSEEFTDEENDKLPLDLQYLPEEKAREPDFIVRKTLLETLLLLCADKFGRNYQKNSGVYYIIRELHTWESDHGPEENIDQCEKLIQILIADDPDHEMENLMKIPQDELEKFEKTMNR